MRKYLIVLVAIVILGSVLGFFFTRRTAPPIVTDSPSMAPTVSELPQLIRQPRTPIGAITIPSKLDPKCVEFWNTLRAVNFEHFGEPDKIRNLPFPPTECGSPSAAMKKYQLAYLKDCKNFLPGSPLPRDESVVGVQSMQCMVAAFFLRAMATSLLTKGQDIATTTDPRVLVDRLIGAMQESPIDLKTISALSERLLKLDPDLIGIAKMAIFPSLARLGDEKLSKEGKTLALREAEALFERAKRMDPNDPELKELEIFIRSQGGEDLLALEKEIQLVLHDDPNSAVGRYYLAALNAKSNNPTEAIAGLKALADEFPDQKRFKDSLDSCLNQPKCNFSFSLGFKIDKWFN